MADDNAESLDGDGAEGGGEVKKGGKGAIPSFLKWVLIGVAAVILVGTISFVTASLVASSKTPTASIPVSDEYTTKRESYDWYTSLDQIRTSTSDPIPASVSVTIALGYKKEDKIASTEITERRIEIIDFLRRFFSEKTVDELRPQNEEILRQQIRDQINDDILSNSRIRDVRFTAKDVVQQ